MAQSPSNGRTSAPSQATPTLSPDEPHPNRHRGRRRGRPRPPRAAGRRLAAGHAHGRRDPPPAHRGTRPRPHLQRRLERDRAGHRPRRPARPRRPRHLLPDRHPRAVRAIAAAGHGLGNHSYSHPDFSTLDADRARAEVRRADTAIRRAAGTEPLPFFRFPYSATTPEGIATVNRLGYADLEFTADTNGYLGPAHGMTADRAVERALAALTPGAVLQLHVGASEEDGPDTCLDAEALPRILDGARARGYRVIDLRTLLDR
ncbi:polysaccharide deacetylase family protein [Kitasatospora sp. NPDC054768]